MDVLNVGGVHTPAAEYFVLGLTEVVADRSDYPDGVEEGRGQGEVDGRAAEHLWAFAERCLDRVERDRTDNRDRHRGGSVAGLWLADARQRGIEPQRDLGAPGGVGGEGGHDVGAACQRAADRQREVGGMSGRCVA